jgi:membrane protein insertase Oxa1/YidC/SpoIIIJ
MLTPKKQKGNKGGDADMAAIMQTQMLYFFPVITILILFRLPAALGLYWIVTAVFSIIQQYFILKEKQEPNN